MRSPENKTNLSRGSSLLTTLFIIVFWFVVAALLIHNRQGITDWYRLRNYRPPANVAQISTEDSMTPYAQKVFYVNTPAIEDKADFAKACPNNGGEKTNILGCYHGVQNGIYVLDVSDPILNGVVQVTAAHEMLHAAYDRLSPPDKQRVNKMLLDYYNSGITDPRIKSTIDIYKKSEPNDVVNEMHSIFGTEISNLPAPLEQYYKKYFNNRAQIAAYSNRYQSEFTTRQAKVAEDDSRLSAIKGQIDSLESDLKSQEASLNSMQNRLNSLHASGNVAEFNSLVPGYNQSVRSFNSSVQTYQNLVDQYNSLLVERNAVAFEENQLNNAISSSVSKFNN